MYTVTAYDMGLPKFDVEFIQVDTANVFTADTIWHISNRISMGRTQLKFMMQRVAF